MTTTNLIPTDRQIIAILILGTIAAWLLGLI